MLKNFVKIDNNYFNKKYLKIIKFDNNSAKIVLINTYSCGRNDYDCRDDIWKYKPHKYKSHEQGYNDIKNLLQYFIKIGNNYYNKKYIKRIKFDDKNASIIIANTDSSGGTADTSTDNTKTYASNRDEYHDIKKLCQAYDSKK